MFHRRLLAIPLVVVSFGGLLGTSRADDAAADDRVAQWVKDLSSDSFAKREAASNELRKAGKPAAEALRETAEVSFDLEVPTRCVNILGEMFRTGDDEAKAAAKTALEALSKNDRKFLARRAKETLAGPAEPPVQGVPGIPGGIAGGIQIQGIGGGNNVRISTRTVNGQRETKVEVGDKQIEITDTNGKDIRMKVTETVNGQQTSKEYAADDLDDLKKDHPEAAELYEQYGGGNAINFGARIRINRGANVLPRAVAPAIRPFRMPFVPRQNVESAVEKLEESVAELRQLEKDGKVPAGTLEKVLERLEEAQKELDQAP